MLLRSTGCDMDSRTIVRLPMEATAAEIVGTCHGCSRLGGACVQRSGVGAVRVRHKWPCCGGAIPRRRAGFWSFGGTGRHRSRTRPRTRPSQLSRKRCGGSRPTRKSPNSFARPESLCSNARVLPRWGLRSSIPATLARWLFSSLRSPCLALARWFAGAVARHRNRHGGRYTHRFTIGSRLGGRRLSTAATTHHLPEWNFPALNVCTTARAEPVRSNVVNRWRSACCKPVTGSSTTLSAGLYTSPTGSAIRSSPRRPLESRPPRSRARMK